MFRTKVLNFPIALLICTFYSRYKFISYSKKHQVLNILFLFNKYKSYVPIAQPINLFEFYHFFIIPNKRITTNYGSQPTSTEMAKISSLFLNVWNQYAGGLDQGRCQSDTGNSRACHHQQRSVIGNPQWLQHMDVGHPQRKDGRPRPIYVSG